MTIASEITRIKTNIDNAYIALEAKGATIPEAKNSANLADTINTVTGGSGETNYLGRIVTEDGVLQFPEEDFTFSLPDNVTSIGDSGLYYAFYGCTNLTSTGLNNVTSIGNNGLYYAFYGCTNLTSTGLNNVTSIGNNGLYYAFYGCTNLTSTGLNNVTSIGDSGLYYAFRDCTSLTSTVLDNVTSIGRYGLYNAFYDCTSLTSLSFPKLNSNSFGSYTSQFYRMLSGVTGCTVHFPSNLESVIGSWSDVTDGFDGTNTTVLFDLPATT